MKRGLDARHSEVLVFGQQIRVYLQETLGEALGKCWQPVPSHSQLTALLACLQQVGGRERGAGEGGSQEGLQNTESFLLKTLHPKNKIPAETVIYISTK